MIHNFFHLNFKMDARKLDNGEILTKHTHLVYNDSSSFYEKIINSSFKKMKFIQREVTKLVIIIF
jgi:hypothetical protein